MSNIIDKIRLSGTDYTLSATSSGVSVVEVTQAEYDALPSSAKTDTSKMYVITDAQAGDLSQYWTSAQTQSAITEATSEKVDTNTYTAYTANTQAVLNSKLDATAYTPVQVSTAITENDTNAVAGGAVYDKVHVTSGNGSTTLLTFGSELIPGSGMISAATNYQSGVTKFNIELDLTQWGRWHPILGFYDSNNNDYGGQIINTDGVITYVDRSDTMYGTSMSATTSYTNNVFTIEVTGLSGDAPSGLTMFGLTNMEPVVNAYAVEGESVEYWIKDYVDAKVAEAGGGSSYSAGTGIDITNDVISVTGMVETSAVTSAVTSGSTDVLTSGGAYEQFGGLKIVKLTESEYAALVDKDPNVLYVVIPDQNP